MFERWSALSLPCHPANRRDQFIDFVSLFGRVTGSEGIGNAMRHMVTQNLFFNLVQRRADGIDLRQDLHAVAIFIDHAQQSADLAFDPFQTSDNGRLC